MDNKSLSVLMLATLLAFAGAMNLQQRASRGLEQAYAARAETIDYTSGEHQGWRRSQRSEQLAYLEGRSE